jgi:hypothetical protein
MRGENNMKIVLAILGFVVAAVLLFRLLVNIGLAMSSRPWQ